ncbi:MAG: MFS transporter, partial [Anaerolineae bacterium]|nr:MFS transporter [Anaerolineae bacterium]
LTDRIGRRRTMMLSFFITPVLQMLLFFARDHVVIGALTFAFGYFIDLYRPAAAALIADVVPSKDRVRAFALRYWAINLGASIGLSLAGWLAQHNYIYLFVGDAVTTFLFGLVVLRFIPETRPMIEKAAQQARSLRLALPRIATAERPAFTFMILMALLGMGVGAIFVQSSVTMPLAMEARGLSESDYGLAVALNGVIIVLVGLPISQYVQRYSRLVVLAMAAVLTGVGFGLNAFATTTAGFAFAVAIWTLGELMAAPVGTAIVADISPVARRGLYQGIFGSSFGAAYAIGPIIGGAIFQRLGAETLWTVCFVIGVLAALGYLIVLRPIYARLTTEELAVGLTALRKHLVHGCAFPIRRDFEFEQPGDGRRGIQQRHFLVDRVTGADAWPHDHPGDRHVFGEISAVEAVVPTVIAVDNQGGIFGERSDDLRQFHIDARDLLKLAI